VRWLRYFAYLKEGEYTQVMPQARPFKAKYFEAGAPSGLNKDAAAPPISVINSRLPIPIAIGSVLNGDHACCNVRRIIPDPQVL
jgi:hypothetical protein